MNTNALPDTCTTLYLSQKDGDDRRAGTSPCVREGNGPLATFSAAFDRIAALRQRGMRQPIELRLMGREYCLTEPVHIDERVSALTILPHQPEPFTLCGGEAITGFRRDTYLGVDCFSAYLPEVHRGEWTFTDLYVDGERAELTRYPETGFLYADAVENNNTAIFSPSKWFIAGEGDIPAPEMLRDGIISFCHYWVDAHTPIEAYDPDTRRVTLTYPTRFRISTDRNDASGLAYVIENIPSMLKRPNQWYLERGTGMLYYIPRQADMAPEDLTAYAPKTKKLLIIEGTEETPVANLRLQGITFAVTRGDYASGEEDAAPQEVRYASDAQAMAGAGAAITFRYARRCTVEKCTFSCLGLHALAVLDGCVGMQIRENLFTHIGAGAIKLNGGDVHAPAATHTHDHRISNNIIRFCGRRYASACGILLMHTYGNTVESNTIHDLFYTGISVGWVWGYGDNIARDNLIRRNHIYRLGQGVLSDMGGVYLLGRQPGTVVSENHIHDIQSSHYGGWAIYTDEGASEMIIERNLCYNTSENAYHQHYGAMNIVRGNIFAHTRGPLVKVSFCEPHCSAMIYGNILLSDGAPFYGLAQKHLEEGRVIADGNLLWCDGASEAAFCRPLGADGEETAPLDHGAIMAFGLDRNSQYADPQFRDAGHCDFTLMPDSPAWAMGFVPIALDDRTDR